MISVETLLSKVNSLIASGNLTAAQLSQLSAIQDNIDASKMSVANIASLPEAVDNEGRLIYVVDQEDFYYSDGDQWTTNFSTVFTEVGGIAYAWGVAYYGRLGSGFSSSAYGTILQVNPSSPVTVVGGITNWSSISSGVGHTVAVTDTGIAYAWGSNRASQLGIGFGGYGTNQSSPVTVVGGITNWSQVSAGTAGQYSHSLGVTSTGIAYAWGNNTSGQLGIGFAGFGTNQSSPVTVVGGITNWSQVSAGIVNSLGLTDTGILYAWGADGGHGTLGIGIASFQTDRSSPVTVVGGITNWSQVSGGNYFSLGVTSTGIAYAWGKNNFGQLGDGSGTNQSSPVTVVGGITNWSQVSAGLRSDWSAHSLGLTDTGIVYAWGNNNYGQLGDGISGYGINQSSPVTVVGGITNWSQVSAGFTESFGVTNTGILYAWGTNYSGELGDGTSISKSSPVTVIGGIASWSQVTTSLAIANPTKGFNE